MLILFCHFDIPYLVVFDGGESLLQIQRVLCICCTSGCDQLTQRVILQLWVCVGG